MAQHIKRSGVYKITNKEKHHNQHLQNAWNLYGEDTFKYEVVEECPLDIIIELEQSEESIKKREISNTGKKRTEEQKKRISESLMGERNPNFGKSSHNLGKAMSEDQKRKISESMRRRQNNE